MLALMIGMLDTMVHSCKVQWPCVIKNLQIESPVVFEVSL